MAFVPWKQEINLPCETYPPCTRRVEGIPITRNGELWAWEGSVDKSYYRFTNSPPSAQTSLSILYKFILSLFILPFVYKINFFLLICVNLIIRPTKTHRREKFSAPTDAYLK